MKYPNLLVAVFTLFLFSCSSSFTTEEYIKRGNDFFSSHEWKSAIIEYKNAVKQSPKNAQARFLLGKVYLKTYSVDAAIKEFNKAVEAGMDKNGVIVWLGKAYMEKGEFNKVLSDITVNDALSEEQKADIYALRATAYLKLGKKEMALEELKKGVEINEDNVDLRLAYAQYESVNGMVDKQEEWLAPLLEANNPDAWSQQGKIEQKKNRLELAESAFTNAINARDLVHLDYLSRVLVRIGLKKYDEALKDIELLKKSGVQLPLITHSEGVIAFYKKDYDLAQSKLDEVLGKYKSFPPSLFVLGLTHYQKKNYESAINLLTKYLDVNPRNPEAQFVLATSLLQVDKTTQAIRVLKALSRELPNNAKVISSLGSAYIKNGQIEEGIQMFKKAAKMNPDLAVTQLQLGSALIRDKKTTKQGQQALMKALDLDPDLMQANLSLFLSYMQSKDFDKAKEIAQQMIEKKSDSSLAYNLLAHAYQAKGEKSKALEILNSTLQKFPSDPLTSNNIAKLQLIDKDIVGAKKTYLKVLEKHPSDIRTLVSLAVISSKQNKTDEKISFLKKAVELNPEVLSPKVILAVEYLKLKEFKKVLNLFRGISEDKKNNFQVQMALARAKMGLKEYDHAMVILKKLLAQNPENVSVHYFLALNYGNLKQVDNMKASLEQVLKLQPEHFAANLILTRLAMFEGKKKEFESRLAVLNRMFPDNADVKYLNAKVKSSDKNYSSAISELEDVLKETPNTEVAIDLARNKWAAGDKDGAITSMQLWIESNPEDKKALMLLAQFYISQNRFEEANEAYEKVNKLLPNNAVVLNNMAWLYRDSDIKQGITFARKALDLAPENPFIKDTLAILLLGDNQIEEALKYSSQAAEQQPNFFEIQINYAKILIANGRKDDAKEILKRIYSKVKSFDKRQEIQTLLNSL